ncbi:MAG: hypothetical protein V5A68_07390 [Candidatus Thermoplasmatota archaeon]
MTRNSEEFEIRDPIYGFITFNEWEKEIIDHPAFQRLRRITQLGLTSMLYPSARHNRFEHSLGVMHLTSMMFDAVVNNKDNLNILKKEFKIQPSRARKNETTSQTCRSIT